MQNLMDYIWNKYATYGSKCDNSCKDCQGDCVQCSIFRAEIGEMRYDCANMKIVYLNRYFSAHVAQTRAVIRDLMPDLAKRPNIEALSLGGGPGVDLCALVSELRDWRAECNVSFSNVDIEETWKDIYGDIGERVRLDYGKITPHFFAADVTGEPKLRDRYDLVSCSWILSERPDHVGRILSNSYQLAKPGGYVVLTDRTETNLIAKVNLEIERMAKLSVIKHGEKRGNCGVSVPERVKNQYLPKLNYKTAYWLLQK